MIGEAEGQGEPCNMPNTTPVNAGQHDGNGLQKLDRGSAIPVAAGDYRILG